VLKPGRVLREEFLERERRLQEDMRVHSSTLQAAQTREHDLSKGHIEYTNALAAAQRALEQKTRAWLRPFVRAALQGH
jgi:hypothetical protein